jgi:hypothetical protein
MNSPAQTNEETGPRRLRYPRYLSAALVSGYLLILGIFYLLAINFDAPDVERHLQNSRSRLAAPLDPMPEQRTPVPVALTLKRDLFSPTR